MLYDVKFRIDGDPTLTVEAKDEEQAKQIAEDVLGEMSDDEIFGRLKSAYDFGGFVVTDVIWLED